MAELKLKFAKDDERVVVSDLKAAKSPTTVMKLITTLAAKKRKEVADQKRLKSKETKLVKAQNINAKSGNALVAQLQGSVTDAKAKLAGMAKKGEILQAKIDKSSDPVKVKAYVAKQAKLKQDVAREKATILRRETKVNKVEKVVAKEGPAPEKKVSKMTKLEAQSPKLENEAGKLDELQASLKAAKAEMAGIVNGLLTSKEAKMKAGVKMARKRLNRDEADLDEARDRYLIAKRRMDADHRIGQAFTNIRDGLVNGDVARAMKAHEAYSHFHNKKRTKAQIREARAALAVKAPGSVCRSGLNCCVKSYKNTVCGGDPFKSLCRQHKAGSATMWTPFAHVVGEMDTIKEEPKEHLVKVNRTMHVKLKWTTQSDALRGKKQVTMKGLQLQAQVCGRFTKYGNEGATVCFPQNADGSRVASTLVSCMGSSLGHAS